MVDRPHEARVWILTLYMVFLANGSTLMCKSIRSSTMAAYGRDVAKLIKHVTGLDPRRLSPTDTHDAPHYKAVLDEVRRLEKVPNKQEPFTPDMWRFMHREVESTSDFSGFRTAMCDWSGIGLFLGPRGSEWAQHDEFRDFRHPDIAPNGTPRAFTLKDLDFRARGNRRITVQQALDDPSEVERVYFCFSWQKNGDHGQGRIVVRQRLAIELDAVALTIRIVQRYRDLVGLEFTDYPLAIYRDASGLILPIRFCEISREFQRVAAAVYNLDPKNPAHKQALARWTSHSLRIGACVILHAHGFSATQIKFLLRWNSDAFMEYLRNLAILSQQQNAALADHMDGSMPNLLV
jgi:hypothetical protein